MYLTLEAELRGNGRPGFSRVAHRKLAVKSVDLPDMSTAELPVTPFPAKAK